MGIKRGKCSVSLGLHFSNDKFSPLMAKTSQKLRKLFFLNQFQTVPSNFSLFLPVTISCMPVMQRHLVMFYFCVTHAY